ncbi:MAG: hypothetical protein HY898_04975 [Deltaproteobacteria bacterium]|nr:hypothetical protein [Deltaproteobacteria bacterium]
MMAGKTTSRLRAGPAELAVMASVVLAACGGGSGSPDSPAPAGDASMGGSAGQDGGGGNAGAVPDAGGDATKDVSPDLGSGGSAGSAGSAGGMGGSAGSAGADAGFVLPPSVSCDPQGDACQSLAASPDIHASFRKDYYLPVNEYNEPTPVPKDGGRFHIAALSKVSGDVTGVLLNGQNVDQMLVEPKMEWYHVWPTTLKAGEPVWFAFHSRDPAWDSASSGQIEIQTTAGKAVDGAFAVESTPAPLTYVTTTDDYKTFLVYVRNQGSTAQEVTGLLLNGRDVLAGGVACVPNKQIAPGESTMFTIPLCTPAKPGDPWTVVVTYANAPAAVGVGRVIKSHFMVEAWSAGSDCAFPGATGSTFAAHEAAGFDTQYMYWGNNGACGYDGAQIANTVAPSMGDFFVLVGDNFLGQSNPETAITDTSAVAGFLTGDESDGQVYVNGVPPAAEKAANARQLWSMYPDLPVYNGGKTNKNVGSFAGMTDIQGMDYYVAACAPHITAWGTHPPLRGAYDYLRNMRNNHMPLPTWMYAQGLHGGWNRAVLGIEIHVQPDPQEILVQAMSVVAAGGKGMMWFQTSQLEAKHSAPRWNAISAINWTLRGVGPLLREGDLSGAATVDGKVLVEAIRARKAMVVPIINVDFASAPTDVACAAVATEAMVPHWTLNSIAPTVRVQVPGDLGVADVFEVLDGAVVDSSAPWAVDQRELRFEGVPLSNDTPVRLIVLASSKDLRSEVAAAMAH